MGAAKMRIVSLLLIVMLTAAAMPKKSSVDDTKAGIVTRIQSSAIAIQDAAPRILEVGSSIFINDIVSTGKDARVEIRMIDDTVITFKRAHPVRGHAVSIRRP